MTSVETNRGSKAPAAPASRRRSNLTDVLGAVAPKVLSALDSPSPARALLLISLFAVMAYANSLAGEFVFDDTDQIVTNQNLRSWNNLSNAFTTHVWAFRDVQPGAEAQPPLPYYRPIFTVMLTAEYQLFGLWPQGWHLTSLMLHILASAGVFYVIELLSGRKPVALFAALLFAVHPVHAESVCWISGMTDPLFSVFFLASLFFYLKSRTGEVRERGHTARTGISLALVLSIVLYLLSAFSKETALSLVLLIFCYEFLEGSGRLVTRAGRAARRVAPFVLASLFYLIPRYLVLGELTWTNPQAAERPFGHTLLTLPFVLASYMFHLAWPVGLSVTYDTRFIASADSARFLVPAALLVGAVTLLFAIRAKITREVWLGLLLIVVPLLPVLNLGQVSREEYLVFDHYLYLSVAGWSYLISIGLARLGAFDVKARPAASKKQIVILAAAMVILAVHVTVAARENRSWSDSYALWSNAARVRPSYWATHYNTGLALLEAKRYDEALDALHRASELKPDEADVFDAIGRVLNETGASAEALASFGRALDLNPKKFESLNNIGAVYFSNGEFALAESYFAAALAVRPLASATLFNLGICLSRQARYREAIHFLERARDVARTDGETYYELGLAYQATGRLADANVAFDRASELATSQSLADKASRMRSGLRDEMRE